MSNISVEELAQYLSSKKSGYKTKNGLSIYLIDKSVYTVYDFVVEELEFSFNLISEEESLHEFIEGFKIKSIKNFEELGYKNSWIRYLNRKADMEVTQIELEEAILNFRLHGMKTMVLSASLHFYDEVYQHLTLPGDFISYFSKNKSKISTAMANRYKF